MVRPVWLIQLNAPQLTPAPGTPPGLVPGRGCTFGETPELNCILHSAVFPTPGPLQEARAWDANSAADPGHRAPGHCLVGSREPAQEAALFAHFRDEQSEATGGEALPDPRPPQGLAPAVCFHAIYPWSGTCHMCCLPRCPTLCSWPTASAPHTCDK